MDQFNKKPLNQEERKFDLSFLLAGNSGSGKTHLCTTYTRGPIHFYSLDKGGDKTIRKVLATRKKQNVTIDDFSSSQYEFSDFWKQYQEDEKAGFFQHLANNQGLLVLDSITNANQKAIVEICRKSGVTPSGIGKKLDNKKGMAQPHWGQLLNWMTTLTSTLQELPCAAAICVHLHTLMNSDQEVVARYPSVNGQFRQLIAVDFDEAYLLSTKGSERTLFFTEKYKYEAKSRVFSMDKAKNVTMDQIADAYLKGKTVIT